MHLSLDNNILHVNLTFWEKVWAVQFNHKFEIPLEHIEQATTEKPLTHLTDVKLPGTWIPGLLRAGTYYAGQGREFWYAAHDKPCLTLKLKDEFYQTVVLTPNEPEAWVDKINQLKASANLN